MAQDPALVLDPVLHADHCRRRGGHGELRQRVLRVLALHRQQDDRLPVGVALPRDLRGLQDSGDGQRQRLPRGFEHEPARAERSTVVPSGDEGDVIARLEQPAADGRTDGTGTDDHEAHACTLPRAACQALGVANLNPVERATALGGSMAVAPLRVVGGLAAPARSDMARNVRRAIGISERPAPIATDPVHAYLPPGGIARRVHADLPTMLIGGVSALLLQTLHPLAMAGVAEHSNYQEDPLGRLRRTAAFVGTTTFGTVAEAEAAIAQVHRVHRRVKGTAPDGRPYSADDPALVTFIHVAEVSSFLASSRRYGPRPLTPEECDQYYDQVAPVAFALGAEWVPRSAAEVESYLLRMQPELYAGPAGARRPGLARARCGPAAERARRLLARGRGGRRRPADVGPPRARALAGRPPGPHRRDRGGHTAHTCAHRGPALDGGAAGAGGSHGEGEPAVDDDDLARHVGRPGQGHDHLGHVLGLPRALERRHLAAPPRGRRPSPPSTACRPVRAPRR